MPRDRVRPTGQYLFGFAMLGVALLPGHECGRQSSSSAPAAVAPAATLVPATPVPDLFASSVRLVLVSHCAPCHEPGGKLYEKLPFDHPEVVAAHAPGVLKRLNGQDKEKVEKWLATLPLPATP